MDSSAVTPKEKQTVRGPYTIRRDALADNYRWKAKNIVRFFEHLGMSNEEKVKFLSQELAQTYMAGEDKQKALRMLREVRDVQP